MLAMLIPTDTDTAAQLAALQSSAGLAELERMLHTARHGRMRGLEQLAASPALAELERMLHTARHGRMRGLEQLAASPDLAELERMLAEAKSRPAEPDLLAIIGVEGSEAVHSNFLAWLLDPAANHGLETISSSNSCGQRQRNRTPCRRQLPMPTGRKQASIGNGTLW